MNKALHLVVLSMCISATAYAQHSPPATTAPTTQPVKLEPPPPPLPAPPIRSNGSSGWVDSKKSPNTATLADIPAMFRRRD